MRLQSEQLAFALTRALAFAVRLTHNPIPVDQEINMSADKDRGIRREKQKRAKALKREAKQHQPAPAKQAGAQAK